MTESAASTLIIGASSGVGLALARKLRGRGEPLVLHYCSNGEALEDLCSGTGTPLFRADLSSSGNIHAFLQSLSEKKVAVRHLVYCPGPYSITSGLKADIEEWKSLYQLNVWTPIQLIQSLMPDLQQHAGSVVCFGVAGIGRNHPNCYNTSYANAKEALWHAILSLAKEAAPLHVRINMVCPGHLENSIDLDRFLDKLPMKRPVKPEEAAALVEFLMSDQALSITGQKIEVAGGAFL